MTTNYAGAFIEVAPDSTAAGPEVPPARATPSVAELQHALLAEHPYRYTSDELLFEVHAIRSSIADADRDAARAAFLAKDQACLRASPLSKRYGWGTHHDSDGRVALVGVGTAEYAALAADPTLEHRQAMRSSRACPGSTRRATPRVTPGRGA
ncbi:DUF6157 family protein [Agrococcus jejuensis]|uniref:Uncharacterized protein n=1 Tax=Agrococcus jejuensis TaxID=399736 RepID=A0A1G8GTT7_9MICO|nr:DUF6157 family protein [Agrococcus jejuensis]SDH97701.1 hypothetical protein SAMN04489720_3065 [Agrococcus jejuensis]